MTKRVYDGFRENRPDAMELQNGWFKLMKVNIPEYTGEAYGGDVFYKIFRDKQFVASLAAE